jgi:hypothetical protein
MQDEDRLSLLAAGWLASFVVIFILVVSLDWLVLAIILTVRLLIYLSIFPRTFISPQL